MRITEKHISVEASPEVLKLMAEAVHEWAEQRNIELSKTLSDWCFSVNAAYQTYNDLDEDDWDFTDEDKEELGIEDNPESMGYWSEHLKHPSADWRYEVANGYTRQSYWQWVNARIEAERN